MKRLILLITIILGIAGLLLFNASLNVPVQATGNGNGNGNGDCTECPTFEFSAERWTCPGGYFLIGTTCFKIGRTPVPATHETFGPIVVQREKSQDPNKCHKPTPQDLDIPSWARDDYGKVEEWVLPNVIDCPRPTPTNCELLDRRLEDIEQFRKDCAENYPRCVSLLQECERNVCRILPDHPRCQQPTPSPTPTPSPIPTPQEPVIHENLAPACPNGEPVVLPENPHVIRKGSDATVNFFAKEGDRANIYFKENGAEGWQHSARDISIVNDYVSYTIHDLNPNLGYDFGIQASNGCAGGEIILAVIVDPPADGVTFNFSYWEVLK